MLILAHNMVSEIEVVLSRYVIVETRCRFSFPVHAGKTRKGDFERKADNSQIFY